MARSESVRPPPGPRILVVEDDAECRCAVREVLEDSSFVVTEARDGQVALDHMARGLHPALVILDLEMPVMSGHELLQIMDNYERLSRLPVLIISGTPRSQFASGGAVKGYIAKPLDMVELLAAVDTCLGSRSSGGQGRASPAPE